MTDSVKDEGVPEGFSLIAPGKLGFNAVAGPFHMAIQGGEAILAVRVDSHHLNPMGNCHGGVLATLADNQGYVAKMLAGERERLALTIQLSIDYLDSAPLGAWLEMKVRLLKVTGKMLFSDAVISNGNEVVARTSAVYKLVSLPNDYAG